MGMTYVKMKIRKLKSSRDSAEEEFLVDSGAAYTVLSKKVLESLDIAPDDEQTFILANGEQIVRKIGEAYFEYGDKHGTSKVIFGEEGDSNLLGSLTLETFALILDPFKRELKAMPMLLM